MDLKNTEAGLILEAAALASGFTFEKKESIYIILPVAAIYAAAPKPVPAAEKKEDEKNKEEKKDKPAPRGEGSVEVIGEKETSKELTRKRYTGNFMFGHEDKIYLNLVIPEVNAKEEKRITLEFKKILQDGAVTQKEAQRLFGTGTEISGKDIDGFLKTLYTRALERLKDDGKLTAAEINRLRNDMINDILETYEGQ
jgi:hypothetical protein